MKRSNGEGTIYKRNDGRWCAAFYDDSPTPKRHFVYGKTQSEVKKKLTEKKKYSQLENSEAGSTQTLAQWILYFLENYKANELKETTYSIYMGVYKKHIKDAKVGKIKLDQLKSNQLQKLYNEKTKEGYNAKTVKHISVLINSALKKAVQLKMIKENVNEMTVLPKRKQYHAQVLSPLDVNRIIKEANNDELYPIVILAISTGLRRGEIMALKWKDIDFELRELQVKGNLCRVPKTVDEKGKTRYEYKILAPKTSKSRRTIPLTDLALDALKRQKYQQDILKDQYKSIYKDQDLVFSNEEGSFLNQRIFMNQYHSFLQKYRIPDVRFHDLRHTFATLLLEAEESPKVIQELLGHSTITTTMDIYAHVTKQGRIKAVDKLKQIVESDNASE